MEQAATRAYALDLDAADGPGEIVRRALDEHGGLDVLVNNVGAFRARTDGLGAVTDADWQASLEVNLLSAVRAIRAGLDSLIDRKGAIINVASINARLPQPPVVNYAAAKAALVNLTATLAEELGPRGVRVNAVSPGPTRTPAWEHPDGFGAALARAAGVELEDFLAGFPAQAGLSTGRLTEPDEVAAVIALLGSGRVRNINGANLPNRRRPWTRRYEQRPPARHEPSAVTSCDLPLSLLEVEAPAYRREGPTVRGQAERLVGPSTPVGVGDAELEGRDLYVDRDQLRRGVTHVSRHHACRGHRRIRRTGDARGSR